MIAMVTRGLLMAATLAMTAAACGNPRLYVYDKPSSGPSCPNPFPPVKNNVNTTISDRTKPLGTIADVPSV